MKESMKELMKERMNEQWMYDRKKDKKNRGESKKDENGRPDFLDKIQTMKNKKSM